MTLPDRRIFGTLEGEDVIEVTIRSKGGAEARIITFGAVIRDLVVPSAQGPQPVCLGLETIAHYVEHSPHFGAVAGRVANRIAGGRFPLDGRIYDVPRNERGVNCLHGGDRGFGTRNWTVAATAPDSVTLTLHSADGDEGFPGAVEATCIYTMLEPATLRCELTATTDAPTVVNLTNHAYFNLDGSADVRDHLLTMHASARTPLDADLIPTGEIAPVAGTPYDFRTERPLRNPAGQSYDTNYVLDRTGGGLVHGARVRSAASGLTMDVYTDQLGLQLYDAGSLDCPVPGLRGAHYGRHAGLCLEAQLFPDAPNHPNFPSITLRPGTTYRNVTEFRFS